MDHLASPAPKEHLYLTWCSGSPTAQAAFPGSGSRGLRIYSFREDSSDECCYNPKVQNLGVGWCNWAFHTMERRLAHPKMQKSDKIIKSCHPHQPCVYDSSGCRRSTPLKFSLDLEGNEQAKMCNLFVLRTSSREFLFLFSLPYLNNSESNVPKHLQFRAFTLIPLKKKESISEFYVALLSFTCSNKEETRQFQSHMYLFL